MSQYLPPEYVRGGLTVDGEPVDIGESVAGLNGRWLGP